MRRIWARVVLRHQLSGRVRLNTMFNSTDQHRRLYCGISGSACSLCDGSDLAIAAERTRGGPHPVAALLQVEHLISLQGAPQLGHAPG
jgi:hypothetical protein